MKKKIQFNIMYFLAALFLLLAVENYFLARNVVTIGYGEFKALLQEKLVNDLVISTDTIDGELGEKADERLIALRGEKDAKKIEQIRKTKMFTTVRLENDPDLVKELGKQGMRYTVRPQSTWLMTLLSVHWGGNWGYEISREEIEFAHRLIESGVDIIHGHSSHHVKGIEIYHDRPILYGCGDFLNDYEGIQGYENYRSDLGLMYFPGMDAATGRLAELKMVPTRIKHLRVNRA